MKKEYLTYIASLLLFGSNGIFAGMIPMASSGIVFYRTLIGSALLAAFFLLSGNRFSAMRHPKSLLMLVFSGMAAGASWMLLYEAYRRIGVGTASLCYYCGPMFVMVLSPVLFGERLTRRKLLCFAAVLLGICLIDGQALRSGADACGLMLGMLSAVMFALMIIFSKKCTEIRGGENTVIQLGVSSLTTLAVMLFRGNADLSVPAEGLLPLLVLGCLNTGIGCRMYFGAMGKLPVQTVAVCGYLEPLSAVIFSAVILHEAMTPAQALGCLCIIGGAMMSEQTGRIRVPQYSRRLARHAGD